VLTVYPGVSWAPRVRAHESHIVDLLYFFEGPSYTHCCRALTCASARLSCLPRDAHSAKRGMAIVSRRSIRPSHLSVRPFVMLRYREHRLD